MTKSKTTEYFPHLLKDSTTIRALEMLYGNDGYAVWFKLLEVLGQSEDYQFIANNKNNCNYLLEKFRVSGTIMGEIINTLCELKAIDKEMWVNHRTLYVPNLVNNLKKLRRKINTNTNLEEPIKAKDKKNRYLEYVLLTDEEHSKLIEKFGVTYTNKMIEQLNNYIGQNPSKRVHKYTSHYHTILVWARNDKEKNSQQKKPQYKNLSEHKID